MALALEPQRVVQGYPRFQPGTSGFCTKEILQLVIFIKLQFYFFSSHIIQSITHSHITMPETDATFNWWQLTSTCTRDRETHWEPCTSRRFWLQPPLCDGTECWMKIVDNKTMTIQRTDCLIILTSASLHHKLCLALGSFHSNCTSDTRPRFIVTAVFNAVIASAVAAVCVAAAEC